MLDAHALQLSGSNAAAVSNLLEDVKRSHQSVVHSLNGAVKYMIECGQFIVRLQASMTMAQIVSETSIPRRTAYRYAELAKLGVDSAKVAQLGEVTATKLLAKPKAEPVEDANAEDMHDDRPDGRDMFEAIGNTAIMAERSPDAVVAFIGVWNRATSDQRGRILDWLRWQKVLPEMGAAA